MTLKILLWISIAIVIYSYVLYPMLLLGLRKVWKIRKPTFTEYLPSVSIVVAAYNEEKVIRNRIENCLKLDYPQDKLEIIIASDGSDDKTTDIVREYKNVVLFDFKERRGKVNVLNDVVPKAKNEIVVFSDANTLFKKDAIKKLVRHFADAKVGCVCGALRFVCAKGSATGQMEGVYWRYETMLKKIEGSRGSLLGANGAIYALHRNQFVKCPEDTIVEDFVVPMKILQSGYRVIFESGAVAYEETTHKIIQEKTRRIRIGAGDFQALSMLWPMLNPKRGFSALAFWSHKVLRWIAPFLLIIIFVTNIFLVKESLYLNLFVLQSVFYLCAFVGQMLSWSGLNIKLFNLTYYFVSMNLALLLGFVQFISGRQQVTWQRTQR